MSPAARNGWTVQRFSAAQLDFADQTSRALMSAEMQAPVAKLVTAHSVKAGLSGATETVVVVRTADTPGSASRVLIQVSPVAGSDCSITSRSIPSVVASSCLT